jgi:hypothetical protein
MKCPYCHKEMVRGRIWGDNRLRLRWLEKGSRPSRLDFFDGEEIGRNSVWGWSWIAAHRCEDCRKIMIDLNEHEGKYADRIIKNPLYPEARKYSRAEIEDRLSQKGYDREVFVWEGYVFYFPNAAFTAEKISEYRLRFQAIFEGEVLTYEQHNSDLPDDARIYLESRLLAKALETDDLNRFLAYFLYKLAFLDLDFYFHEDEFGSFYLETPLYGLAYDLRRNKFVHQKTGFLKYRKTMAKTDLLEALPQLLKVFNKL